MSWSLLAGGYSVAYVWDMIRWGGWGALGLENKLVGEEVKKVGVPLWYVRMRGPLTVAAVGGSLVGLGVALSEEGKLGRDNSN